jgi:hypothetical protein
MGAFNVFDGKFMLILIANVPNKSNGFVGPVVALYSA